MMSTNDLASQAHEYNRLVIEYERIDKSIDTLLAKNGGVSKNLSDEDYAHFRELVDLRDLAYNRMKTLERTLLDE